MCKIRILGHNAFWYQAYPFVPSMPGDANPDVMSALVDLYRELDPDLLCIQEVQDTATFENLANLLGMEGRHSPGCELVQYGTACFWMPAKGRLVANPSQVSRPPMRSWLLAAAVLPDRELRVANMHLPSTRQLSKDEAARRRVEEVDTVLSLNPPPDVVLGDLNELPGGPLGAFFEERGFLDAAVLTGKPDLGTNYSGTRGDQIWVRRELADNVADYGVVKPERQSTDLPEKKYLSDHIPLWIDLKMGS